MAQRAARKIISSSLFGLAALCSHASGADAKAPQAVTAIARSAGGVAINTAAGTLTIEPWTERIVRVRFHTDPAWAGTYNPAVIARPAAVQWSVAETADTYTLSTAALKVRVNKANATIAFLGADGKVVLDEFASTPRGMAGGASGPVSQAFGLRGDEFIYGLGQHQTGRLDNRHLGVRLQQANTDVAVPMLTSSRGYGILWNNPAVTEVDVAIPQKANQLVFRSEAGGGIDYDFIMGPELDTVIAGYRWLTGTAPMMPRWTWGLWQSKERYKTQDELLSVAARHRAMGVPFDAVVQDWQYWEPGAWGSHAFDPKRFPDPAGMVKSLHDQHVHSIISVWMRFDPGLDNLKELERAGALYPKLYTNVYPAGFGRWYDAYSPAGRDIYWRQIMRKLGTLGFDGWWLDGSETELGGDWGQLREVMTAAGPGAQVYNASPLLHTTAVHDGSMRDIPNKRAFILTRSAYAGQQRNAAITWSGDTVGNWDIFARQIPAGLNFSLSGIPYWSADIGGFFGGSPRDPKYAELFTRWYQFGVFNPMFRVHGTGEGKEIWQFSDKTQQTLLAYDKLRYRLLPYIYATSWDVTNAHGSMMRALAMDFRTDHAALGIQDQYMFGKALLVNPVVQPGAKVRTVYLPGQESWYDFWSGQRLAAGQVVAAKADIDTIPLYVRAGSVLPLGPVKQYADEKSAEPTELRVYPGRNGGFDWYDDAGDGYGYKQGEYATVQMRWDDAGHTLTLSAREGQYPGMPATQAFKLVCAAGQAGATQTKSITYAGQALSIALPDCVAPPLP
ncbi:MAG: glycoside hydrolase family 31 protein [Massilia sp.]